MSALAEKLTSAGVDTIGAKLTTACIQALRKHPGDVVAAWRQVGTEFGHEFMRNLMIDMAGKKESFPKTMLSPPAPPRPQSEYRPRVISTERVEARRKLREIVRSKFKNSAGVAWSDVGWHELPALARDGGEAAALLAAGPAHTPNDGRSVGAVLGIKQVDQIIAAVRS